MFEVFFEGRSSSNRGTDESASIKKPQSAIDAEVIKIDHASWPQLILILSLAVAVPVLLIAIVCCCVRFRKQGYLDHFLFRSKTLMVLMVFRRISSA